MFTFWIKYLLPPSPTLTSYKNAHQLLFTYQFSCQNFFINHQFYPLELIADIDFYLRGTCAICDNGIKIIRFCQQKSIKINIA